jgi:hypothetical protein
MSQTDRDRLAALKKAKDKKITQQQAAEELKLSERQVRRLGRPSNRKIAETQQHEASKETVRKWMCEARLWRARREKVEQIHRWRPRRERYGELVQWDTSEHDGWKDAGRRST